MPTRDRTKRLAQKKRYRETHQDEIKAYQLQRRTLNPELVRTELRRHRELHPESVTIGNLRTACKRRGITEDAYYEILIEQDGLCAICREEPGARRLHIDHDHDTGRVRGLLCFNCNSGIGKFHDEPDKIEAAAEYVRKHRQLRLT